MQYLKYGFYAVIQKPLFNILIMLEVAAILVAGNMAISVFNSRAVLYEPYADILNQDGYLFFPAFNKELGTLYNSVYDDEQRVAKFYDSLKGDLTIVKSYYLQVFLNDVSYNLYSYDPTIFSKMRLPLKSGRWPSSEKNAEGQIEAVVNEVMGVEVGTVFPTKYGDIKVTGILGERSYTPSYFGNISEGYRDIRMIYEIDENPAKCFFVSSSAHEAFHDPRYLGTNLAYIYPNLARRPVL